jgi:hypothetical protein
MSIELDRNGVPQYSGASEHFNEYVERAWDLFYGREGKNSEQAATALHLRSGLSGPAYEAVRKVAHSELTTVDEEGVLIDNLKLVDQGTFQEATTRTLLKNHPYESTYSATFPLDLMDRPLCGGTSTCQNHAGT